MKYIQVIDGARNCAYDIFAATDEEFALVFPTETDIAFIDEVYAREHKELLDAAFNEIWRRRVRKSESQGIHGILFYELDEKKVFYPTRRDEEAVNSDGSRLRWGFASRFGTGFALKLNLSECGFWLVMFCKRWKEAQCEDWSLAAWKNIYGMVLGGEHYDDPGEAKNLMDYIKSR